MTRAGPLLVGALLLPSALALAPAAARADDQGGAECPAAGPAPFDAAIGDAEAAALLSLEAPDGEVRRPLTLEVRGTPPPAPDGGKAGSGAAVLLSVQPRSPGGPALATVRLLDEEAPALHPAVWVPSRHAFELHLARLPPGGTARFDLVVEACRRRSYPVVVKAVPLAAGLRVAELSPEPLIALPFQRARFEAHLPLTLRPGQPLQWRLEASDGDKEALRVPWERVTVSEPDPQGVATLAIADLEPGHHVAALRVNGEPLKVDLTVKNPWWVVFALVLAGAVGALRLRRWVESVARRADNERKISEVEEREPERQAASSQPLFWDHLRASNALRRARGANRPGQFEDVDPALAEATATIPRPAPALAALLALGDQGLPAPVRADVERELRTLRRIGSSGEAGTIPLRLQALEDEARLGFRRRVADWLADRKEAVEQLARELHQALDDLAAAPALRRQVELAIASFQLLVEEGQRLLVFTTDGHVPLAATHADLLERAELALAVTLDEVRAGRPLGLLDAIQFADPKRLPLPLAAEPALPAGRLSITFDPAPCEALTEVTFVARADQRLEAEVYYQWRVVPPPPAWRSLLEGEAPLAASPPYVCGPELSYVFERAGRYTVEVRGRAWPDAGQPDGDLVGRLEVEVRRPDRPIDRLRRTNLISQLLATLLAASVAALLAVGLLWTGKAWGDPRDYLAALAAGIGADVVSGGAGAALVSRVMDALLPRVGGKAP